MRALVVGALLFCACASAKDDAKPARPAKEIVSGAGQIRGGGIRMDVTIGAPFSQKPAKGGKQAIQQGTVTP
jgi:hypothetical protein